MRKIWVALTAFVFGFCFMVNTAQSQSTVSNLERDDHESGLLQVGWGVVTASSTATGLVAFETFGLRETLGMNQAGVLPSSLTTSAIIFVDTNGRLSKNLGVAIVNPNASSVDATMTLRDSDGTQLGSTTITVPAGQQVSKFVTELFDSQPEVPKDVTGTLAITATSPISVIGLRFRGRNFSTLPVTNLSTPSPVPPISVLADSALKLGAPVRLGPPAPVTTIGGPNAILLPQFAAGLGWATEIDLANTGSASITVRVDLFKSDGTPLKATLNGTTASSFMNIVIPAGGVFILGPHDDEDDNF